MKKVKAALTQCSKTTFGNIVQEIEALEDVIRCMRYSLRHNPPLTTGKDFIEFKLT
uniref:Uncharacterized protein n=1 Tax=Solanum tuberosum TaxID=4113 RepID=M1CME8_SOLTU